MKVETLSAPWPPSQHHSSMPPEHRYTVLPPFHEVLPDIERRYDIQRSIITSSSLNCVCLYCYQGFARMEDLYRHASDGGEGHSSILRENRNRDPRGFYDFFREALNLTDAHIDDWTICHTRVPALFDPDHLMELLKTKKGHQAAITLQDAVILATGLRATCPSCHCSFSLHSTLKSHLKDKTERHKRLLSEPDGRFDTARVIEELVNGVYDKKSELIFLETGPGSMSITVLILFQCAFEPDFFRKRANLGSLFLVHPTTFYDVITGETRIHNHT